MRFFAVFVAVFLTAGCSSQAPLRLAEKPMTYDQRLDFNRSPLHGLTCYECKWGMSLEEKTRQEIQCNAETGTYDCRGL